MLVKQTIFKLKTDLQKRILENPKLLVIGIIRLKFQTIFQKQLGEIVNEKRKKCIEVRYEIKPLALSP